MQLIYLTNEAYFQFCASVFEHTHTHTHIYIYIYIYIYMYIYIWLSESSVIIRIHSGSRSYATLLSFFFFLFNYFFALPRSCCDSLWNTAGACWRTTEEVVSVAKHWKSINGFRKQIKTLWRYLNLKVPLNLRLFAFAAGELLHNSFTLIQRQHLEPDCCINALTRETSYKLNITGFTKCRYKETAVVLATLN